MSVCDMSRNSWYDNSVCHAQGGGYYVLLPGDELDGGVDGDGDDDEDEEEEEEVGCCNW